VSFAGAGNISFRKLSISDLDELAVIGQSLDNQWVAPTVLSGMVRRGQSFADVADDRSAATRVEYLRSLINASQAVVNRAYLLNNPVVTTDFREPGPNRDAFKALLEKGIIVPFFFDESSPVDETRFSVAPERRDAWDRIAQETEMRCVRLSWDDAKNREYIRSQLITRFGAFVQQMNLMEPAPLARDLALNFDDLPAFRQHLGRIVRWSADEVDKGHYVTRDALYKQFVVADETRPDEGHFDRNKPFAAEIKQLVDLNYNVNLADALAVYPLTPRDSLRRAALQEWQALARQPEEASAEEIIELLRRSAFAQLQEGLYLDSLAELALSDVPVIRETQEWYVYAKHLADLLRSPLLFNEPETGASAVLLAYVDLARVITEIGKQRVVARRVGRLSTWQPVVEIVFEVAGALISVVFAEQTTYRVLGSVAAKIGSKAAPCVMRLIIRGWSEHRSKSKLGISVDLMRRNFRNAEREWEALVAGLRGLPNFTEVQRTRTAPRPSNYDYQGDLVY
jgi:hypothetical protein